MEKMTNIKALAYILENIDLPTEVAEKVAKIKDTYEKKSGTRKPTKRQEENTTLRTDIKAYVLANDGVTATQVLDALKPDYDELTLPRVFAQLAALVKDAEIERSLEKR